MPTRLQLWALLFTTPILIALGGCNSVEKTREPELDATAPWCGPIGRAEAVVVVTRDWVVGVPMGDTEWWYDGELITTEGRARSEGDHYLTSLGIDLDPWHPRPNARPFDGAAEEASRHARRDERFPYTHTFKLVCIRPKVMVAVPFVRTAYEFMGNTALPWHPVVMWYSAELGVGPTEAEALTLNTRWIPLQWGGLLLERVGDNWVVTAQSAQP